jgi:hypothetical protein
MLPSERQLYLEHSIHSLSQQFKELKQDFKVSVNPKYEVDFTNLETKGVFLGFECTIFSSDPDYHLLTDFEPVLKKFNILHHVTLSHQPSLKDFKIGSEPIPKFDSSNRIFKVTKVTRSYRNGIILDFDSAQILPFTSLTKHPSPHVTFVKSSNLMGEFITDHVFKSLTNNLSSLFVSIKTTHIFRKSVKVLDIV